MKIISQTKMSYEVDWNLLADFFDTDLVDFEYELYGRQNYRRDAHIPTQCEMQGDGGIGEALGLLDGCPGVSENGGLDWLERNVRTSTTSCDQEPSYFSKPRESDSDASVSGMQIGHGDRGYSKRPSRVPVVWPDPVSGCVYGGTCALFDARTQEQYTCVHPPLQQDLLLLDRDKTPSRRKFSYYHKRDVIPFASRDRWERNGFKSKRRLKKDRFKQKI